MRRSRRIVVSTAVTTGVLGVAGVAVAAAPSAPSAPPPATSQPPGDPLADQKAALTDALSQLDARTHALELDLGDARRRLASAEAEAAARAAAARAVSAPRPRTVVHVTAPRSTKPPTHTTTGASGATGDDGGEGGDGGGDD